MIGKIDTMLPEQCSRCGDDFNFEIHESFRELLIPPLPQERSDKYAKINHFSDMTQDDLDVTQYSEDEFFLTPQSFFMKKLRCPFPYNPAPAIEDDGKCRLCGLFSMLLALFTTNLCLKPLALCQLERLEIKLTRRNSLISYQISVDWPLLN